jgi:phosphinothricin acetyltransferase
VTTVGISEEQYTQVSEIYAQGLKSGVANLTNHIPTWTEWDTEHLSHSRIIVQEDNKILAWAALSPLSGRCVFGGIAEVSVYTHENARGKGLGKIALDRLITESENNGIYMLQSSIMSENLASLRLHEKAGFRIVGTREKFGKLNNEWKDIVLLEKRSKKVGL